MLITNRKTINFDCIALILILVGEICFYTLDSLCLYLILTGFGMILGILHNANRFSLRIRGDNFILWVCVMYTIYFVYGFLFLQKGEFPWDTMGYRFLEIVVLYLIISNMFSYDILTFQNAIVIAGIISAAYLIYSEGFSILLGGQRIGDSLSGNVNTVGFNFGIISTIIMWSYCKQKTAYKIILFLAFSVLMLITGSKKVLIIIIANLLMFFWYEKKKINGWVKTFFILIITIYVVFNVPYFYDIIGSRVEAMIETMLYGNSSTIYSYSTNSREKMIQEAFKLFLNNPFFGGGWNYFYSQTIYGYEYSHCNYTEMLCSFGIIGTAIFYGRHIYDARVALKERKTKIEENRDLIILILILTAEALTLDWAAVTFSAQCVWYLPIIICAASIRTIYQNKLTIMSRICI